MSLAQDGGSGWRGSERGTSSRSQSMKATSKNGDDEVVCLLEKRQVIVVAESSSNQIMNNTVKR
jgi:hypothetical protein